MFDTIIDTLLQSSWQILVLTILVWPLTRLSVRRHPNFAYILWVVVLVKALFPISFSLPSQQIQMIELPTVFAGGFISNTGTASAFQNFTINYILVLIWLAGVFALTVRLLLAEKAHHRKIKLSKELIPEPWFGQMKAELGISRQIKLYSGAGVHSPLTHGLFRVRIYLPEAYKSWESIERQSILAHELIHVRRKDMLVIYLQAIVRILYFFHPAVWLVNDQIDLEREKICDDEAIDISSSDRGVYGEQLFKQVVSEERLHATSVLASGFFMTDHSILKRFRYIKEKRGNMNNKLKLYHLFLILMVISVAVVIACSTEAEPTGVEPNGLAKAAADGFVAFDTPPHPVGGYAAIQEAVQYPKLAFEAGIGGTTILQLLVDVEGNVGDAQLLKSAGDKSLDSAAIEAALKIAWIPAQKQDEPVAVRITIPIAFKVMAGDSEKRFSSSSPVGSPTWDIPPSPVDWKAIGKNIIYPEAARRDGVTGTLTIRFTIDEHGELIDPEIVKGPDHAALKAAAVFALNSTKWKPAEKDGIPISASLEMGIGFEQDSEGNPSDQSVVIRPLKATPAVNVAVNHGYDPEELKEFHIQVFVNGEGIVETHRLSGSGDSVKIAWIDEEVLNQWYDTKWEAIPKTSKLKPRWINLPIEFTFID